MADKRWLHVTLVSTAISAALVAETALAQPADSPAAANSADQSPADGEIVVTANRREQKLSNVGISVSVLSSDAIADRGISSASDLSNVVPGFTAGDSAFNVPLYSLRGVGFNDGSLGGNSTVAVYVDEIPLAYPALTQGAVLDLQRIEVLKGLQGTLYGQNATAGAINYIANKPTDTLSAGGEVDFGRFNTLRVGGFVSGPLSDTLKARITGEFSRGDAWQYSITRNDRIGKVKRGSGRALFNWNPASGLAIDLSVNGWFDKSDSQMLQLTQFTPQRPANIPLLPQVFSSPLAPADARAADWTPGKDYGRNDSFIQAGLKIGYDISEGVRLTSISAYSHYEGNTLIDRDGVVPVNFETQITGRLDSYYQELRLSGDTGALVWNLGANYRKDNVDDIQDTSIREGTSVVNRYRHTPVTNFQDIETYAGFADGEFRVNDQISVVGGIRYTEDRRKFKGCTADSGAGDLAAFFTPIMNSIRGANGLAPLPAIAPGACVTLSTSLVPGLVETELNQSNVSYHVGLNWKPAPRTLVYVSASQGYKAGAYGTIGSSSAVANKPVGQEKVNAYEAGIKASPLGSQLQLELAAFYYDYKDKQQRGRILDATFGSLSTLVNVPKSSIYGFEASASYRPIQELKLYSSYLYLNTEIKKFTGVNFIGVVEDFSGDSLNYSPKHSINAGAQLDLPASENLNFFTGVDVTYRSATSAFFGNVPGQEIREYTLVDLRAGIENPSQGWKATIYGRNVFDQYYWNNVVRANDTVGRLAARPASYGINFAYKF